MFHVNFLWPQENSVDLSRFMVTYHLGSESETIWSFESYAWYFDSASGQLAAFHPEYWICNSWFIVRCSSALRTSPYSPQCSPSCRSPSLCHRSSERLWGRTSERWETHRSKDGIRVRSCVGGRCEPSRDGVWRPCNWKVGLITSQ